MKFLVAIIASRILPRSFSCTLSIAWTTTAVRFVCVGRVRVRRVTEDLADARHVVGAGPLQFSRRDAGEGDERALGGVARAVDECLVDETVPSHEDDLVGRHQRTHVEQYLGRILVDRGADVEEIRTHVCDLRHQRLVIGRLRIVPLGAEDFAAQLGEGDVEDHGEPWP